MSELDLRRENGRLLDVAVTISPVLDAAGQVDAISPIARDLTDTKRDERAA